MIRKSKLSSNFTTVPNGAIEEIKDGLALGVLVYLLSKPHDWITQKQDLYKRFSEGRIRIDKAFKILMELGYIEGVQRSDSSGKFIGFEWIVYDFPIDGKRSAADTENRLLENRQSETEQLLNTEVTKTILTKEKTNLTVSEKEESEQARKCTEQKNVIRKFGHLSITKSEFDKLLELGYTCQQVNEILDSIENYRQNKKYANLYLTARKWLKIEHGVPKLPSSKNSEIPKEVTGKRKF